MSADAQLEPSGVLFRPCERDDLPGIQQILALCPEAASWSQTALETALSSYPEDFLVAMHEQEISGFIIGRRIADEGEILNVAIHPQWRRRGLATGLVQAFLKVCARDHVVKVFLEVRESNSTAISFYRRLGFRHTARRPDYYSSPSEAALMLSLELLPGR